MSEHGDLRVSDADRERAAREVREHFAAGRLTEDELNTRIEAVYDARSMRDLDAAAADLPALPPDPRERRAQLQRQMLHQAGGALVPFAVCVAIWLASGAHGSFWPIWVLLFALLPLLRNGWELYGPAGDLDRVERDLDRRRRHRHRHRHR